ncbi:MAG: hypothetical protein ABIH08_06820 [Candidatus Omnitrophota bacterium]
MDVGRRDILELIAKSGGRTRIDKSKLPWPERRFSRLKDYLKDLCELDNIKDEGDDIYSLTEKGKQRVLDKNYSNWKKYDEADLV